MDTFTIRKHNQRKRNRRETKKHTRQPSSREWTIKWPLKLGRCAKIVRATFFFSFSHHFFFPFSIAIHICTYYFSKACSIFWNFQRAIFLQPTDEGLYVYAFDDRLWPEFVFFRKNKWKCDIFQLLYTLNTHTALRFTSKIRITSNDVLVRNFCLRFFFLFFPSSLDEFCLSFCCCFMFIFFVCVRCWNGHHVILSPLIWPKVWNFVDPNFTR